MFLWTLCSGCRTPASPVYHGRDARQRKLVRALNTGMGGRPVAPAELSTLLPSITPARSSSFWAGIGTKSNKRGEWASIIVFHRFDKQLFVVVCLLFASILLFSSPTLALPLRTRLLSLRAFVKSPILLCKIAKRSYVPRNILTISKYQFLSHLLGRNVSPRGVLSHLSAWSLH